MYGMVNQAIKDLVVTQFGEEKWKLICKQANVESDAFVFMHYYPDKLTYDLVGAASGILGVGAQVVLEEFGKYWVLFTAKEGYGPMMDLFGSDFKSCLRNLNNLHARMGMTMPNLTPPRFTYAEETDNDITVGYYSKRAGLGPMVIGLLKGLAIKHNTEVEIIHVKDHNTDATEVFKIKILG